MGNVQAAVRDGDFDAVILLAHSLKGSSGNIGLQELYEVFLRLEEMGRTKDLPGAEKDVEEAARLFEGVEREYRGIPETSGP